MAPLPDLPLEMILKIIEYEDEALKQQCLLGALRSICGELHAKTLHFFGARYLTQIRVSLTEKDASHLQATSQSALKEHVKELVVSVDSLFEKIVFAFASHTTNGTNNSQHPKYTTSTLTNPKARVCDCILNESVADFIEAESCKHMLGTAVAGFSKVSSISLRGPSNVWFRVADDKAAEIDKRWVIASGIILSIVLSKSAALKRFVAVYEPGLLCMRPYAFEVAAVESLHKPSSLEQLRLCLDHDPDQVSYPKHIRKVADVFKKSPNLTELHLELPAVRSPSSSQRAAPCPQLGGLSDALPPLVLQRLTLCKLTTDAKALGDFINAAAPTLRHFSLKRCTLSTRKDFSALISCLQQLSLLEVCVLSHINTAFQGLYFGKLNAIFIHTQELSPDTVPGAEDWVCVSTKKGLVHKFEVRAEDEDNVYQWLEKTRHHVERGQRWGPE